MSTPVLAAVAAFLASLVASVALSRARRPDGSFALLLGAPVVAVLTFVGVAAASHDAAGTPSAATAAAPAPAADGAAPRLASEVDGWRHAAGELRGAHRYAEARDVFRKIVAAAPMDADAWADLGDATAAAAGDDLAAGSDAIDRALSLDPRHAKALWLKASLELQQKRYAAAVELWQRLLAVVPAGSNDARIVKANLEESQALAAGGGNGR